MRVSVKGSRELRATALALKGIDRDVRRIAYQTMRETMNPVWRDAVSSLSSTPLQVRLIDSGTLIKAGSPPVLQAGASKRRVGRGLIPAEHWIGPEYGAKREAYSRYKRRSPKGKVHTVERRTMRHLPARRRSGYVLGPAVAETLPRLTSLFVQSVVRTVMDYVDGGRR